MIQKTSGAQYVPSASFLDAVINRVADWLDARHSLLSAVMEETVTNRQMLLIGHCFVAFFFAIGMADVNLFGCLTGLLWFGISLIQAKKGGLR